jgi:hypothetical protein
MCRKAQGAAFRSRARVRAADFHCVAGEELLTFYESLRRPNVTAVRRRLVRSQDLEPVHCLLCLRAGRGGDGRADHAGGVRELRKAKKKTSPSITVAEPPTKEAVDAKSGKATS